MDQAGGRAVIVGAGHAGGTVAAQLRQNDWAGAVVLIGEEPIPPYQRPPLSKAWLKGEADAEALALRPDVFWAEHEVELRLGVRATEIDRAGSVVMLQSGERVPYDRLVLATGRRARRIPMPGMDLEGVLELRTAADADRLKQALGQGRRLAVVGGGYIGLETAASARALGADVCVIELQDRLLARVACQQLSDFMAAHHRSHGVEVVLSATIVALEGQGGRVSGVRLADGRSIGCDLVLVGVGSVANQELAEAAGLLCDGGIVVDLAARTQDPAIYAVGDCTCRPLPLYEGLWRPESVPNALEQAKQAAADICGGRPPPPEVPWFWSDQYDLKLQIAGLSHLADSAVLRGDPSTGRFAVFHLGADHRLHAVEAINAPAEFMAGRQLIGARKPVAPEKLRDMSVSMRDVAA